MRTFSYILALIPVLAPFAAAEWYVDFSEHGCQNKVLSGAETISGTKKSHLNQCVGGAAYPDGSFNTRSVHVKGLTGTGLKLTLYAARGCAVASANTVITRDGCYTSSTTDPLNYMIMKKK